MKVHVYRPMNAADIEIGDVVLWENDNPIEVESITRTKDGFELSGHNRLKPGTRAVTIRPTDKLRVLPNPAESQRLADKIQEAIDAAEGDEAWTVEMINDLKPLIIRSGRIRSVSIGPTGEPITIKPEEADAVPNPTS